MEAPGRPGFRRGTGSLGTGREAAGPAQSVPLVRAFASDAHVYDALRECAKRRVWRECAARGEILRAGILFLP